MKRLTVSLAAALLVTALLGSLASTQNPQRAEGVGTPAPGRPLVALSGAHSQIHEKAYLRATAEPEWTALYLRHLGQDAAKHSEYYNEAGIPEIDFERCMAVAIHQGDGWNSAGVQVVSIEESAERVLLRFVDRSYQSSGPDGGGQRVSAFGLFLLPRSNKVLVLEENVQDLIGQPPVWKKRALFPALSGR